MINHATIKAFNELWYRKAPRRRIGQIVSIPGYFHPLDSVGSWNRLYGRRGFVQYQCLLPFGAEDALREVIERLAASGAPSFLGVLKRFGAANPAPLSFPAPGLDAGPRRARRPARPGRPAARPRRRSCSTPAAATTWPRTPTRRRTAIRRGYPRLDEWRAVRAGVDPAGVWASDLSRRLRLLDD